MNTIQYSPEAVCYMQQVFPWAHQSRWRIRHLDRFSRFCTAPAPSKTVTTARIAPKICQGQPPTFRSQCSKFHPNRFTFGGVIAERVKAVLLAHRVFAIFAWTSGKWLHFEDSNYVAFWKIFVRYNLNYALIFTFRYLTMKSSVTGKQASHQNSASVGTVA